MSSCYLLNGFAEPGLFRLVFYDPSEDALKKVEVRDYKPYFFTDYPIGREDEDAVRMLNARVSSAEKTDLLTGRTRGLTRVEIDDPSLLPYASKYFDETWESEIPPVLGYVYDCNLNFGARYLLEGDRVKPNYEVPDELKLRFRERFSDIETADPQKYEMLERWFMLCSQPIPEIPLEKLGVEEALKYENLYVTFLLSRVANLPLPTALVNRKVSTWIKSILHSYLRRKNILVPSPSELRRGETKQRVQGALTFSPKSGTYFNTVVVDFESLYPSLIDVYNLSYETVDCGHEECKGNNVPGVDHHVCKERRGVYSILIGALKDLRIRWFKPLSRDPSISEEERRLAEAAAKLLKLILVASYGVTVRIHGLAQPSLAESITAYGRYALRESWSLALNMGLHPIYGDTDSLFLDNPSDEEVRRLITSVKERLRLDLAIDKVYSVCVLPRAMKAYFGIRKDGTPDVKGLTAIKSNSPSFIQKVFRDCVRELKDVKNWAEFEAAKENMRRLVRRAVKDLKDGRIPIEDLEYTVKLHFDPSEKPIEEEMLHQPYQCAVQMVNLGRKVQRGDIISFVKVKPFNYGGKMFTVKPTDLVKDMPEININDYIRNLQTALSQTFKPMNLTFKEEADVTLTDFI